MVISIKPFSGSLIIIIIHLIARKATVLTKLIPIRQFIHSEMCRFIEWTRFHFLLLIFEKNQGLIIIPVSMSTEWITKSNVMPPPFLFFFKCIFKALFAYVWGTCSERVTKRIREDKHLLKKDLHLLLVIRSVCSIYMSDFTYAKNVCMFCHNYHARFLSKIDIQKW